MVAVAEDAWWGWVAEREGGREGGNEGPEVRVVRNVG